MRADNTAVLGEEENAIGGGGIRDNALGSLKLKSRDCDLYIEPGLEELYSHEKSITTNTEDNIKLVGWRREKRYPMHVYKYESTPEPI